MNFLSRAAQGDDQYVEGNRTLDFLGLGNPLENSEQEAGAGLLSLSACAIDCDTRLSLGLPSKAYQEVSTSSRHYHEGSTSSSVKGNNGFDNPKEEHLFTKVLQVSDVNKLNRLVIPKQYARRCFPRLKETNNTNTVHKRKREEEQVHVGTKRKREESEEEQDQDDDDDHLAEMELTFRDHNAHEWQFNYKYWASSKTYVFSKGWIQYVKRYKLTQGDEVSFYRDSATADLLIRFRRKKKDGI